MLLALADFEINGTYGAFPMDDRSVNVLDTDDGIVEKIKIRDLSYLIRQSYTFEKDLSVTNLAISDSEYLFCTIPNFYCISKKLAYYKVFDSGRYTTNVFQVGDVCIDLGSENILYSFGINRNLLNIVIGIQMTIVKTYVIDLNTLETNDDIEAFKIKIHKRKWAEYMRRQLC